MYGNSSSKDMNLLYPSSVLKQEELQNREFMESDLHQHRHPQQQQLKSSLMRYRSAPSYLIENSVHSGGEGEGSEDFLHPRSSSSEAETIFERFMYCSSGGDSTPSDLREIGKKSINERSSQFLPLMENNEAEIVNEYSPATKMMYQTDPPPPLPNHGSSATGISYRMTNLMEMEHHPQVKTVNGNCSNNLIRHSSSPAGLFSHLTVENGYPVMRGMGNFKAVNSSTNGEASPSSSRLKGQINFSHGSPPSSGLMSQISEIGSDSIDTTSPHDGSLRSNNGGNRCFIPGFQMGSWEGSTLGSENFSGLKRVRDYNEKNGDIGHHSSGLTHNFSLPKTSSEIAAMEKFLQFQDSVPCKIRAKRGCATHPRSIAERVRRTRISERMRKLQELVPNMEKQTNTSDMLDFAVEYIKDLQKQVKTLNDKRANCTCSGKQKPNSNPTVRLAS